MIGLIYLLGCSRRMYEARLRFQGSEICHTGYIRRFGVWVIEFEEGYNGSEERLVQMSGLLMLRYANLCLSASSSLDCRVCSDDRSLYGGIHTRLPI
jgi:hypothetical protein